MLDIFGGRFGACDGVSPAELPPGRLARPGRADPAGHPPAPAPRRSSGSSSQEHGRHPGRPVAAARRTWRRTTPSPTPRASSAASSRRSRRTSRASAICELMPRHARAMDKMAIVRSLAHESSDHFVGIHWVQTGFTVEPIRAAEERAAERRVDRRQAPGAERAGRAALRRRCRRASSAACSRAGPTSGPGYNPFNLNGDPTGDMRVRNLEPAGGL